MLRTAGKTGLFWALMSAQRGRTIDEIASKLMELGAKATEDGEQKPESPLRMQRRRLNLGGVGSGHKSLRPRIDPGVPRTTNSHEERAIISL